MSMDLAKSVWSEQGLMELFGCSKKQVRRLTLEGGLAGIRLGSGLYVFLAEDVIKWLLDKRHRFAAPGDGVQNDEKAT